MIFGSILGLGDSLVAAARAEHDRGAGRGWLERLPALLDPVTGTEWAVLNRGISGQTTREVLDRTPGAVRELAGCAGAKWAVVLCSTNDSKGGGADLDAWEALYRLVVHWPRRHGIPLALCTLPPLDPRAMPSFTAASQAWCLRASDRTRAIAAELHNRPSPVYVVELADLSPDLLVDGVHLTAAGNAEVARRVAAVLAPESPVRVGSLRECEEAALPAWRRHCESGPLIRMHLRVGCTVGYVRHIGPMTFIIKAVDSSVEWHFSKLELTGSGRLHPLPSRRWDGTIERMGPAIDPVAVRRYVLDNPVDGPDEWIAPETP